MSLLTYDNFHPYQKRVVAKAVRDMAGYEYRDTGMDKTVISLAIFDQLKKRRRVRRGLIVAPKYVMNHIWRQEAKKWEFSKDFTFSLIHGSTYRGSPEYSRRMAFLDVVDFHLINYEGLTWLSNHMLKERYIPWDIVFYDESTRMKRTTTKRFKAFRQFMNKFPYRFNLTGTPIPNGLEDIFGQAIAIDNGEALEAKNISEFRRKYMRPLYTLHGRVTVYGEQDGANQRVAKRLAPRTARLKKTDYLKLPPLKYHTVPVELPPDVIDMYNEMEGDFFTKINGVEIETFSQVAADMKLRQMLQGRVYDEEGVSHKVHTEKQKALASLKLDGNSLIAYNFKFERDEIKTATGGNPPFLDSRTKDREAEKWIIGWNNYEFRYFLVNPASAAFGLNLQAGGNNIVWFSLTWNSEHYSQLIDRLWRQGQQASSVNVYHIVVAGTIDEVISKALQRKDSDQAKLMQDIVNYMRR